MKVSDRDAGDLLHVAEGGLPLFHIAHYTRTFERGAECMHEIRLARCGGYNEQIKRFVLNLIL